MTKNHKKWELLAFGFIIWSGDGDILSDFVVVAEFIEALVKFGEGDFDGDEVDFGVGLFDEFDEIITVAVH